MDIRKNYRYSIGCDKKIDKLLANSDNGKMLKEGISTVIVGKPNAGKSSLLNFLVGEEKAIVTDIAEQQEMFWKNRLI